MKPASELEDLIDMMARLPGLGPRSARRAVLHMIKKRGLLLVPLAKAMSRGAETAREILSRGYRRIGFIGTKFPLDFRAEKRFQGFTEALAAEGVGILDQEFYPGASTLRLGRDLTAKLLDRSPDLDVIYYSSDTMSCGGLMHCLMNDIEVPGKLALAGFNGLDLRNGMPMLTATMNAFMQASMPDKK